VKSVVKFVLRYSSFVLYIILIAFAVSACGSSKKYYQKGQYDMAIRKAVKKLRKKPAKEKEILVLEKAFNKANERDNDRINFLKLEGNPEMWDEVYSIYSRMKIRQGLVKSVAPLEIPSTGRKVQFKFVNYDEEIINAKKKAAEYYYTHALALMEKGDRENAKKAYSELLRVKKLFSNFRDVDEQIKKALALATLKVVTEPIPMHSRTLKLSNEFFDNKINEFLDQMPASEFVRFYTQQEARAIGLEHPDHIIKLQFDDFVVGQTLIKEREIQLRKDNVIIGIREGNQVKTGNEKVTICHIPSGKPENAKTMTIPVSAWEAHSKHGDTLGACSQSGANTSNSEQIEVVFGTVKATLYHTTKTIISKGLLDFQILDYRTNKVLTHEKFPGEFVWVCEWGYFNGDERALNAKQKKLIKNKKLPPPPPQDLFIGFTKPIYNQITVKIREFYRNY